MRHRKCENIVTRRIAGETILVPIRGTLADLQRLFVLEGLGEFIWERIDGLRTTDEVLQEILAEYEVPADDARRDLQEFLVALTETDLIAEVPASC